MALVMFYQLSASTAADTLAALLPRALQQGWRVMVRGTDPVTLDRLDEKLWLGAEDSFLPHGREGGPRDGDQPVLIGQGPAANRADALALIDGAEATEAEIAQMQRVWLLFEKADENRLADARARWKALSAAGVAAQYWSDEDGRWVKKAENQPVTT